MNDGQRVYPVNYLILHHSMGSEFIGSTDLEIQDWFSQVGKGRAYNNGAINPMHEHPGRPGELTYAQAQFAGVIDPTTKYNYRIVDLIARPFQNVAWHAGNWDINTKSVGIECCGNYTGKYLEDKQLMCIADWYREVDKELNGNTVILGHREVSDTGTACPGLILEQRDRLVDMINNPDKWNTLLFPVQTTIVPEPTPVEPEVPVVVEPETPIIPDLKPISETEPEEPTNTQVYSLGRLIVSLGNWIMSKKDEINELIKSILAKLKK